MSPPRSLGAAARVSSFPQREQSLNWAILFGCTKQCMRAAGQPRSSALWPFHPLQRKLCTVEINLSSQIVSPLPVTSPCVSCSNLKKQQRKLLLLRQDNSEDGERKSRSREGERESNLPPPSPSVSQAQARRRTISLSSLPASQEPAPCFPSPSPPLLLVRSSSRDAFSETRHRLRNSSARLSE